MEALRRFLPSFRESHPPVSADQRRALWALTHCRTPALGGQVFGCKPCGRVEFAWHSCNHKACPQCGRMTTARWVQRELRKLLPAPYFMVTFTLPAELRGEFFGPHAQEAYDLFFHARLLKVTDTHVTFRWKDRQHHRTEKLTLPGVEFVRRYLRHVLPQGLRSVRYYGFCHPAAKAKRLRVQLHAGMTVQLGAPEPCDLPQPSPPVCPCCNRPMRLLRSLRPHRRSRAPPTSPQPPALLQAA